jgi:uncharacterized iron-regulated protein
MKKIASIVLSCAAACAAACNTVPRGTPLEANAAPAVGDIVDAGTSERIPFATLVSRLEGDRAVYVGEAHNNDHHHAFQAQVVRALHAEDPRLLIGMEMFQRPFQEALDRFLAGETDEAQFLRETEYFKRWRWDYRYYRPILLFAREKGLPVVALNSPREANRRVSRGGGLSALTPEDKKWVAKEIDLGIAEHRAFVMKVFENHPMGPGFDKDAFYASQCLWEDTMAESVAMALDRHPGHRMVVIVGGGHVRKRFGVPVRAERRGAAPYSILLGMTLGDEEAPGYAELLAENLGDFLFYTEDAPESPPSPRLGFRPKPTEPGQGLVVMSVTPGSTADRAGLQPGDRFVRINETPIPDLEELRIFLAILDDPIGVIEVERNGTLVRLPLLMEPTAQ